MTSTSLNASIPVSEFASLEELVHHLESGRGLAGVFVQSVDVTGVDLRKADVRGGIFLGCPMTPSQMTSLQDRGAVVFPTIPDAPVNPYRADLYQPHDLYDAPTYADSVDSRVYAWSQAAGTPPSLGHSLIAALHDHAISDALDELTGPVDDTLTVGIMGGHAAKRGSEGYAHTAELSRGLAKSGYLVATGGGPGAMEAGNLGAVLADSPDDQLEDALGRLATVASFTPSIDDWVTVAMEVREEITAPHPTLGIPTWFYGHEPPNVFATHIAKYFSNALREDVLLQRCKAGIVYQPGAAGTVQELFQAVTGSYYAAEGGPITPLILVGEEFWRQTLPAWPLLQTLARGRAMEQHIHLVDDPADVAGLLTAHS